MDVGGSWRRWPLLTLVYPLSPRERRRRSSRAGSNLRQRGEAAAGEYDEEEDPWERGVIGGEEEEAELLKALPV